MFVVVLIFCIMLRSRLH